MKKLKIVPLIIVPAIVLLNAILYPQYYTYLFESVTGSGHSFMFGGMLGSAVDIIRVILKVVLPIIFFATSNKDVKDKAYQLFRVLLLVEFVCLLPLTVFHWSIVLDRSEPLSAGNLATTLISISLNLFSLVCLAVNKPEKKLSRIDLVDYELVSYTSKGHRFLHYVLDVLLFNSFWNQLTFIWRYNGGLDYPWLIFVLPTILYVLYYFLSELFFLQTFGKVFTGSVVVSSGGPLSARRILTRSLCRIIPFEAFSFLGNGKWHDNLSHTVVVYRDTWEKVFAEEDPEGEKVENTEAFSI